MHGIKKIKTSEDKKKEIEEHNKEKIIKYRDLQETILSQYHETYTGSIFRLTQDMLSMNAEHYSMFNYRRKYLLHQKEQRMIETEEESTPQFTPLVHEELEFLKKLLMNNPKSYWCWFHREWCIFQLLSVGTLEQNTSLLTHEIELCQKLLTYDSRNFHCWKYRMVISKRLSTPLATDLDYTLEKINGDFNNYSAWHLRSTILPTIFQENPELAKTIIQQDFILCQHAFYTEPNDQSSWIYYRWLLNFSKTCYSDEKWKTLLCEEVAKIRELFTLEADSKWVNFILFHLLSIKKDPHDVEEMKSILLMLQQNDPLRKNFYLSLVNKCKL